MILFFHAPMSCGTVSHIALEESGLPFEIRRISFENTADVAALRLVSPDAKVPAVLVDGVGLTENIAIVNYVASLAPDAQLLPLEPLARSQCMALLAWSASTVHLNFRRTARPERFSNDEWAYEGIRASGREAFWGNLITINERLERQPWMLGQSFSVADAYVLRFYEWGIFKNHPVKELTGLKNFVARMIARPAVRRVLEWEGSSLLGASGGGD